MDYPPAARTQRRATSHDSGAVLMGAGNVKLAYARWSDLADGPMRLFVYMALTALDDAQPPTFWGGREVLALALGRVVADRQTVDADELAERRRAFKAVDRMIASLKEAGAITQVEAAAPGHTAAYALNVAAQRTPATGDRPGKRTPISGDRKGPKGPPNRAPKDQKRTPVGGPNAPRSPGQRTPISGSTHPDHRGPEEDMSKRTEEKEQKLRLSTTSHPPRVIGPSEIAPVVQLFPKPQRQAPVADAIADASVRRAKAIAEHQARLAAQNDTEVS